MSDFDLAQLVLRIRACKLAQRHYQKLFRDLHDPQYQTLSTRLSDQHARLVNILTSKLLGSPSQAELDRMMSDLVN